MQNNSNYPNKHKYAAYYFMLNELNNIPMGTNDYNNELNTIEYIAQENGHNSEMIEK